MRKKKEKKELSDNYTKERKLLEVSKDAEKMTSHLVQHLEKEIFIHLNKK